MDGERTLTIDEQVFHGRVAIALGGVVPDFAALERAMRTGTEPAPIDSNSPVTQPS